MIGTRMKATLPKASDNNGLSAVREQLLKEPMAEHVAIIVFDCTQIVDNVEELVRVPVIRIRRIEPVLDADRAAALLAEAREIADGRLNRPTPLLDPQEGAGNHGGRLRMADGGQHV